MPSLDDKVKSSWVDQLDDEPDEVGYRNVEVNGNNKIVTEIQMIDGQKCRVARHFKVEKRRVTKNVAQRKAWVKFGASKDDDPGPQQNTTIVSGEEIKMEFLATKEEEIQEQDINMSSQFGNQSVQCRNCGLNHWTLQCPYKNQLNALSKLNESIGDSKDSLLANRKPGFPALGRDGKRLGELPSARGKDENNTIRITNLPEETQDSDIRDLFKDFGRITRIFLAKDKATGNSKGFAFVSFELREQALRAIKGVHRHGYHNLILNVEWARPSTNQA